MNINEFLKLDKPEEYDFKLEGANALFGKIDDALERYLLYKSTVCKGSKYYPAMDLFIREDIRIFGLQEKFDCDRAKLTREIYAKIWGNMQYPWKNPFFCGETMTSMQTMLNMAVEPIEEPYEKEYREKVWRTSNDAVTLVHCLHLYYSDPEFIQKLEKKYPKIQMFANYVHTIGNFLPVPPGFNVARSKYDYWDLTLVKIREWYFAKDPNEKNAILSVLLEKAGRDKENVINKCERWLSLCGKGKDGIEGWKNFVSTNYMDDFVEGDEAIPIMFYENHSWSKPIPTEEDLNKIFDICSELIYERSQRMVDALRAKQ